MVLNISASSPALKAGLQQGDVVVEWRLKSRRGNLQSPFELSTLEAEDPAFGPVILDGFRGTERRSWHLDRGQWQLRVRPRLDADQLRLIDHADGLLLANRVSEAVHVFEVLSQHSGHEAPLWFPSWSHFYAAESFANVKRWTESDRFFEQAFQAAERHVPTATLHIAAKWAKTLQGRNELSAAQACYRRALASQKKSGNSTSISIILHELARLSWRSGDVTQAQSYERQSLALRQQAVPDGLYVADSLDALAVFSQARGNLDEAEEFHRQALNIKMRLAPGTISIAATLNNLGALAQRRGDLETAEQFYLQNKEITSRLKPDSLDLSYTWNNLGLIAYARDDLRAAKQDLTQAITLARRLNAQLDVAADLNNLGSVLQDSGDLTGAEDCLREAAAIQSTKYRHTLRYSVTLDNLGIVLRKKKQFGAAVESLQSALQIRNELAPGSLDAAEAMYDLGQALRDMNRLSTARQYFLRSSLIRHQLAPNSAAYAESLASLAEVTSRLGAAQQAAHYYEDALNTLDRQADHAGGPVERRFGIRAKYAHDYLSYVEFLVQHGRYSKALEVSERLRARNLLDLLSDDTAEGSSAIDRRLLQNARELRERLAQLLDSRARLELATYHIAQELENLNAASTSLLSRYYEILAGIRAASPVSVGLI